MLDQQTRTQISAKFQQIKPQLKQHFSGVTDQDLERVQGDPDLLVETISSKTGEPREQIVQRLVSLVGSSQGTTSY
jgi:uncharacterized protein YjbJ (UPF0337 family)